MRFAAVAALAGAASATVVVPGNGTVYATEVVTAYTTFCPAPTTITQGDKTYTVTKATTLTLDCPCTITKPVLTTKPVVTSAPVVTAPGVSAPVKSAPAVSAPAVSAPAISAPVVVLPHPVASGAPVPAANGTATYNAPTASATATKPVTTFTGAANKAFAASGAGLAAVFGLVAYVL